MHNAGCSSLQGWQKGRKYLPYALAASSRLFVWTIAAQLAAGTCILLWLCDWVKDKGLSDGYTLVFGLNIAAGERRAIFYSDRHASQLRTSYGFIWLEKPIKPVLGRAVSRSAACTA
jgi:preprotein translocase subunit SecY